MDKKIIYDLGSNNGDDIPYYLLKSDLVIAVEANPILCKYIENRFISEINQGRLIVENCVLTVTKNYENVNFYIHKTNHVLSQFPKPNNIEYFDEILLPSKTITNIINKYGTPYYVKIDLEHYDHKILNSLYNNNIIPPYISAESHSIDVFHILLKMGYKSFKLVEGQTVSEVYKNCFIQNIKKESISYSFPYHSAGPFGNDIDGEWLSKEKLTKLLYIVGLGWKDIHASYIDSHTSY